MSLPRKHISQLLHASLNFLSLEHPWHAHRHFNIKNNWGLIKCFTTFKSCLINETVNFLRAEDCTICMLHCGCAGLGAGFPSCALGSISWVPGCSSRGADVYPALVWSSQDREIGISILRLATRSYSGEKGGRFRNCYRKNTWQRKGPRRGGGWGKEEEEKELLPQARFRCLGMAWRSVVCWFSAKKQPGKVR